MYELSFSPTLTPLNANQRLHWHAKAALTKSWRTLAFCAVKNRTRATRIGKLDHARITITVSFPDNRRRDIHNLMPTAKAIVDGLIDAGVLPDDDDKHLVGPDLRRGPRHDGPNAVWHIAIEPL